MSPRPDNQSLFGNATFCQIWSGWQSCEIICKSPLTCGSTLIENFPPNLAVRLSLSESVRLYTNENHSLKLNKNVPTDFLTLRLGRDTKLDFSTIGLLHSLNSWRKWPERCGKSAIFREKYSNLPKKSPKMNLVSRTNFKSGFKKYSSSVYFKTGPKNLR